MSSPSPQSRELFGLAKRELVSVAVAVDVGEHDAVCGQALTDVRQQVVVLERFPLAARSRASTNDQSKLMLRRTSNGARA